MVVRVAGGDTDVLQGLGHNMTTMTRLTIIQMANRVVIKMVVKSQVIILTRDLARKIEMKISATEDHIDVAIIEDVELDQIITMAKRMGLQEEMEVMSQAKMVVKTKAVRVAATGRLKVGAAMVTLVEATARVTKMVSHSSADVPTDDHMDAVTQGGIDGVIIIPTLITAALMIGNHNSSMKRHNSKQININNKLIRKEF